jgi:hypothetical protein
MPEVTQMNENFSMDLTELSKSQAIKELESCNEFTVGYGLYLSDAQIKAIAERRLGALKSTGRVEFKNGILKKIVAEFCDSPFITQDNYEETISELLDSFYYFKNESMDRISDDELISFMKKRFDGFCQGSLEYLSGTTLEDLCRNTRYGFETDDEDGPF